MEKKRGRNMATSSIFSNVRIRDLEKADAFVDALSEAAALSRENTNTIQYLERDPEKIRKVFARRKENVS